MSWKNVAIRRINLADQDDFKQKLRSHPAVDYFDNSFFIPIEKLRYEPDSEDYNYYVENPTRDEMENIIEYPDDEDEGVFSITLKPGYKSNGSHDILDYNRGAVEALLRDLDPCDCINCMNEHESHTACKENECHLSGWFEKNMPLSQAHENGDHSNCYTSLCEDVIDSHSRDDHSRCSGVWCYFKHSQDKVRDFWKKLDGAAE